MANVDKRVFLVCGDDADRIRQKADELVRQCSGGVSDPFAVEVFREQEGKDALEVLAEFVRALKTPSFFGGKTVALLGFSAFEKEPAKSKAPKDLGPLEKLLAELSGLLAELPEGIAAVLSGPDVDKRKALFKACQGAGEVFQLDKPEVSDRKWQDNMGAYIASRAQARGLVLEPGVVEFLTEALGTETGRVDNELEKLSVFVAGTRIPLAAAQLLVPAEGESIVWNLTGAAGDRKTAAALEELHTLMGMPDADDYLVNSMVLSLSGFFRQLLQIRIFMRLRKLTRADQVGDAIERMDDAARDEFTGSGLSFFASKVHPYRAKILARQAHNYSEAELQEAISSLRDLNLASVSTATDRRAMLEEAILRITAPPPRARR